MIHPSNRMGRNSWKIQTVNKHRDRCELNFREFGTDNNIYNCACNFVDLLCMTKITDNFSTALGNVIYLESKFSHIISLEKAGAKIRFF